MPGRVHALRLAKAVGFRLEHLCSKLQLPNNLERPALVVVVKAHEPHDGSVSFRRWSDDGFDEPLTMAHTNDVALSGRIPRDRVGGEERLWRDAVNRAVRLKKARGKVQPSPPSVVEAMRSARGLQFITPKRAEKIGKTEHTGGNKRISLRVLGGIRRDHHCERACQLEKASLRERLQDGVRGGRDHGEASLHGHAVDGIRLALHLSRAA